MEAAYPVMSDLELDGATRERYEIDSSVLFERTMSYGISQHFTPEEGTSLDDLQLAALAAARSEGWEMEEGEFFGWSGCRPSLDDGEFDVLRVQTSESSGIVVVKIFRGRC